MNEISETLCNIQKIILEPKLDDYNVLITGFDSQKKIFYTLDNTQHPTNGVQTYHRFMIPYEILHNAYEALDYRDKYLNILYLENSNSTNKNNPYELLKNFLYKYLFKRQDAPYIEKTIVKEILHNEKPIEDCRILMMIYHSKEVLYQELGELIKLCMVGENLYQDYTVILSNLLKVNKLVSSKLVYLLYKQNTAEVDYFIQMLIESEIEMESKLIDIYFSMDTELIEYEPTNIKFENNQDSIISITEKGEYKFEISEGKIYDYWQNDEAPKLIFSQQGIDNIKFTFQTKLELVKYEVGDKFVAGIFIRIDKNEFYIWGYTVDHRCTLKKLE